MSVVWDVIGNHEEWHTRSVVGGALSGMERTGASVASRQIRSLWPAVWNEEGAQRGVTLQVRYISVFSKSFRLEEWLDSRKISFPGPPSDDFLVAAERVAAHADYGSIFRSFPLET